jgi:hypothetical protein
VVEQVASPVTAMTKEPTKNTADHSSETPVAGEARHGGGVVSAASAGACRPRFRRQNRIFSEPRHTAIRRGLTGYARCGFIADVMANIPPDPRETRPKLVPGRSDFWLKRHGEAKFVRRLRRTNAREGLKRIPIEKHIK